jgi:hypothetical protein
LVAQQPSTRQLLTPTPTRYSAKFVAMIRHPQGVLIWGRLPGEAIEHVSSVLSDPSAALGMGRKAAVVLYCGFADTKIMVVDFFVFLFALLVSS